MQRKNSLVFFSMNESKNGKKFIYFMSTFWSISFNCMSHLFVTRIFRGPELGQIWSKHKNNRHKSDDLHGKKINQFCMDSVCRILRDFMFSLVSRELCGFLSEFLSHHLRDALAVTYTQISTL